MLATGIVHSVGSESPGRKSLVLSIAHQQSHVVSAAVIFSMADQRIHVFLAVILNIAYQQSHGFRVGPPEHRPLTTKSHVYKSSTMAY